MAVMFGVPCPLAPVHKPDLEKPARDWQTLFRSGVLEATGEGDWAFEVGEYGTRLTLAATDEFEHGARLVAYT